MNFDEFWQSLTPAKRAVLVTLHQTSLSEQTGGFHRGTISTTIPLIHEIYSTKFFQREYDPGDKVNHFGDYLRGVFNESGRFERVTSDKFEQVCLLLMEHHGYATRGF